MPRSAWMVLGALATILLGACSGIDSALERGAEERPPLGAEVTLPPDPMSLVEPVIATEAPTPPPGGGPRPTPTPLPGAQLSDNGPWLIGSAGEEVLVFEADGTLVGSLAKYSYPHAAADLQNGTSEMHGFVGLRNRMCAITECEYVLRLFRLPGLEPIQSIELLYPSLAWDLGHGSWSAIFAATPALMAVAWEGPEPALLWSPDGRYLAFVGAIDGPSADVYAFDTLTSNVLRLTDGPGQPVLMGWSPDSRWVIHMEAEFAYTRERGVQYRPIAVWAADVEGGPATYLYASRGRFGESVGTQFGDSEVLIGWRSDHEFVVAQSVVGRLQHLAQVDLLIQGGFNTLYLNDLSSTAVDPVSGTVAYIAHDLMLPMQSGYPTPLPGEEGIYIMKGQSNFPERLEYDDWFYVPAWIEWIPQLGRFFAGQDLVVPFTVDGEIGQTFPGPYLPHASPDGKWLVFERPPHFPGVGIYTPDGAQVLEFQGFTVTDVIWKRDSSGFYLYGPEAGLRFFPAPTFTDVLVHPDPGFGRGGTLRLIYP